MKTNQEGNVKNAKIFLTGLILASVILAASGCVRSYLVHVDSISDSSAQLNKTYLILPGNKGTGGGDLLFKEFAGLLVRAMAIQGYTIADVSQKPDIEIYLSYGIGEPETHTYSYSEPVWGQTGVNIYTQTDQYTGKNNLTTTNSSTFMEPQYGVTGYTEKTGEVTVYKKFIVIDAYDLKNGTPGAQLREIWKTSIDATGKAKDLRKVFPGMLAAAEKYIGVNTGETLSVEVAQDSPVLKAIKGN
jgi:hypothetical protein